MKRQTLIGLVFAISSFSSTVWAEAITTLHLDQYNGYFSAKETFADLKPGKYRIEVTNKAGKLAGFQIQNAKTHETLDMFPLSPGETKSADVTVTADGFRYRCPINPTPWYEVDNIKAN